MNEVRTFLKIKRQGGAGSTFQWSFKSSAASVCRRYVDSKKTNCATSDPQSSIVAYNRVASQLRQGALERGECQACDQRRRKQMQRPMCKWQYDFQGPRPRLEHLHSDSMRQCPFIFAWALHRREVSPEFAPESSIHWNAITSRMPTDQGLSHSRSFPIARLPRRD